MEGIFYERNFPCWRIIRAGAFSAGAEFWGELSIGEFSYNPVSNTWTTVFLLSLKEEKYCEKYCESGF